MCIIKRQTDKQTNECIDSYKNVPSMDVENHHHHRRRHVNWSLINLNFNYNLNYSFYSNVNCNLKYLCDAPKHKTLQKSMGHI